MKTIKIVSITLIIAITTCFRPVAAQVNSHTFQQKIVISSKEVRIDSLLKAFSGQTGAEFSFNSNKISPSKKMVVSRHSQTLSQWLAALQQTLGVQHKVIGNHIILVDNSSHAAAGTKSKALSRSEKASSEKSHSRPASAAKEPVTNDKPAHAVPGSPAHATKAPAAALDTVATVINTVPAATSTQPTRPAPAEEPVKKSVPAKSVTSPGSTPVKAATPEADAPYKTEAVQFFIGCYDQHGSGDRIGLVFGSGYTRYLTRRFSLHGNLRGIIHSGEDTYEYIHEPSGTRTDASVRYMMASVQLGVNAQFSFVRSLHHECLVSLGAFGRYQSDSRTAYSTFSSQQTGLPVFLVGFDNRTPQKILAMGGLLQLQYNFTFGNNIFVGVLADFQTDTNDNPILQGGLTVGKRF